MCCISHICRYLRNVNFRRDESVPVSDAIKEQVYKLTADVNHPLRSREDLDSLNDLRDRSYHWLSHPFRRGYEMDEVGQEEKENKVNDKEEDKE